jgi:DNA-binding beta-propeller fold protein YncE
MDLYVQMVKYVFGYDLLDFDAYKNGSLANMKTGLTFSPDGKYAYVTDTGSAKGFYGNDYTKPASM